MAERCQLSKREKTVASKRKRANEKDAPRQGSEETTSTISSSHSSLRLRRGHVGFLVALLALQTLALAIHPNLPDWWNADRKGTPFEAALVLLCLGLAFTQVFANRRLLDHAHREFCSKTI